MVSEERGDRAGPLGDNPKWMINAGASIQIMSLVRISQHDYNPLSHYNLKYIPRDSRERHLLSEMRDSRHRQTAHCGDHCELGART